MKAFGTYSPDKFTGTFDKIALKHLLNRVYLGFSIEDFQKLSGKTLDQTINLIFAFNQTPNPPLNYYQSVTADTTGIGLGETWVNSVYGDGTINSRRRTSLRSWWFDQMNTSPNALHEKMIIFWHNHFATELDTYGDARYGYKYQDVLRKNAFGNFKQFVKAITLDPAMLNYLNGFRNTKTAPDENYGRELQELFTVGKGPGSKYTEDDVKAAAKVLTGYRINGTTVTYNFSATNHDTTDKTFSAFYDNKIIKGKTNADGEKELDELLEMIFSNNEVALFLVRKLYVFFFHYDITPEAEAQFIAPMANIFRKANYEILPLLKAMFSSKHFFDPELYGAIIKSPLDHLIGTTRPFNLNLPLPSTNIYESYLFSSDLLGVADRAQQVLGDPPSVAGWPAYYQAPVYHEIWINASTFPERTKFTDTFIKTGYKRNGITILPDLVAFVKKLDTPSDPVKLINELEFYFFQIELSNTIKTQLKTDILLQGQSSDYYWTELWTSHLASPTTTTTTQVTTRLKNLISYFMSLPEYQLS